MLSCPNFVHVNIIYLFTLDGVKTIFYLPVILRLHYIWEMGSFEGAVSFLKYLFNGKGQSKLFPGKKNTVPLEGVRQDKTLCKAR